MKTVKQTEKAEEDVVSIREQMRWLPGFLQGFLTWLTGKPLINQQPKLRRSNLSHLATAYAALSIGLMISLTVWGTTWCVLLPVGWILTVSGARKLMTTINHYCVHKDLLPEKMRLKHPRWHEFIADFNSSLLFLGDYKNYADEHHTHHKLKVTATMIDPDMIFMWMIGFRAGYSRLRLWLTLLFNLFFPLSVLHLLFMKMRIKTVFLHSNPLRAITTLVVVGLLVYLGITTSGAKVWWAILFPLTYLYHIASLLQFASEHIWLHKTDADGKLSDKHPGKELFERIPFLTVGRFSGSPIPDMKGVSMISKVLGIAGWAAKMLFVHLPIRLFVLPGDLPQHDWHHRCGFGADWPNAAYARQQFIKDLKATDQPFTEIWGFWNVIAMVFDQLSRMSPLQLENEKLEGEAVMSM
ncbi:MAG: hypothetical protein HOP10_03125 [Chitinophagaceae bacterium]|nr:hypothetical protein [Chitinophagaceae bacterium]